MGFIANHWVGWYLAGWQFAPKTGIITQCDHLEMFYGSKTTCNRLEA